MEDTLTAIAKQTDNNIILYTIVIIIALVLIMLPLYRMIVNNQKATREHELKREQMEKEADSRFHQEQAKSTTEMLKVIKENSASIATLSGLISSLQESFAEQATSLNMQLEYVRSCINQVDRDIAIITNGTKSSRS